jgi:flagellar hook protein FlgE
MALIGSLGSGESALDAFTQGMNVIGDNIANVNTTAFKSSTVQYDDSFANILQNSAASPSSGNGSDTPTTQVGEGVNVGSISTDFTQGTLSTTGQPTDFAVSGAGFFQVRNVQGGQTYATRAGDFRIDDQGYLVTSQGYRVQGLNDGAGQMDATVVNGQLTYALTSSTPPATVGDLKINSGISTASGTLTNGTGGAFTDAQVDANAPSITGFGINSTGDIMLQMSNGDTFARGKVLLQNYQDPSALVRVAGNLYSGLQTANPIGGLALSAANNTPSQNGVGQVQQGVLEVSNVDLTDQFTQLINTQRSFQAGSRVITTADTILQEIVNLVH